MDKPGERDTFEAATMLLDDLGGVVKACRNDRWLTAYTQLLELKSNLDDIVLPLVTDLKNRYGDKPSSHRFYPTEKVLHD